MHGVKLIGTELSYSQIGIRIWHLSSYFWFAVFPTANSSVAVMGTASKAQGWAFNTQKWMVRRHTYWQSKRVYWVGEPRCRVKNCSAMWLSILGFMVMGLVSQVVSGQSFWLRIPLRENLHLQNFIIPSVLFPLRLYSSTFFLGCLDKAPYTHLPK